MSFRKFLFSACILLAGFATASSALAQVYSFRVTDGTNPDPEEPLYFAMRSALGLPELKVDEPFSVRVEALDVNGERVTSYSKDVLLSLHARLFDQVTQVLVSESDFVDGVAVVDVTPLHAGSDTMRFKVTDGNITTDDASSLFLPGVHYPLAFTVNPAEFRVTYVGGEQGLNQHAILADRTYYARVTALNSDGSPAAAWRGNVELRGLNLGGSWTASIGIGGISDFSHLGSTSLGLRFDLGGAVAPVTEVIEASLDEGVTWTVASAEFEVFEEGTDRSEVTVDRLQLQGQQYPGNTVTLRYRLNNESDDPTAGAVDTLFMLVDPSNNDRLLLLWTEQYTGSIEDETGDFFTTFQLPQNLLGDQGYELWIRPNYSQNEQEVVTISPNTHPDLAIVNFDYPPGEYRGGDGVRFQLSFMNLPRDGVLPSSRPTSAVEHNQSYKLQLHLSTNPNYGDEDDYVVWEGVFTGNEGERFVPGHRIDVSGDFMLPDNFDGTYYLLARINSDSPEDESPAAGRNSYGFQPESNSDANPGNNTTAPRVAQRISILPRQATETFRVSLTNGGGQANDTSDNAVMSSDGRHVAFESYATLAGATAPGMRNIFVRNVSGNDTILVSLGMSGAAANGHSGNPSISADGRQVAFQSSATNLVPNNLNGYSGIFVRNIENGVTNVLTVNPWTGAPANHGSQLASISGDGRFVVFESGATNLLEPGDPAANNLALGERQIYLYDRSVNGVGQFDLPGNTAITLVSRNGDDPATSEATRPRISSDGQVVTFVTLASNILSLDPNFSGASSPFPQIVRWNRDNGRVTVVSVGLQEDPNLPTTFTLGDNTSGYPAINGNGEYIAFASRAQNLTEDTYFQSIPHVFRARIHNDVVVEVVRLNAWDGSEPNATRYAFTPVLGAFEPTLSEDGQLVAFTSESTNLLPPITVRNVDRTSFDSTLVQNYADDNGAADVYLFDLTHPDAPRIRRASVTTFGYGTTQNRYGTDVIMQPPASRRPAMSGDGRYVAFTSEAKGRNGLIFGATNYIYGSTNGSYGDIYVFDLKERASNPPPSPGTLPTVSLLTPGFGSVIGSGSSWPLVAEVRPGSSAVSEVSFYAMSSTFGTIYLGDGTRFPPSDNYVLNYSSDLLPGTYNLVVAVRDENGNYVSSSPVIVTIRAATQALPTIDLTSPNDGEEIAVDSNIILSAFARHSEGDVTQVDFYANGNLIGTDTGGGLVVDPDSEDVIWWIDEFSFSMGRTFVSSASFSVPGTYSIVAVARDEFGNRVSSAAHTLNVLPQAGHAPSVSMLQPTASFFGGVATSGSSFAVAAQAHDADGTVARLEIFANGNLIIAKNNPNPVLSGVWQVPLVPGVHQIYAVATDDAGNRSVSTPISVTVRLATKDGPGVELITPSDGESFTDQTALTLTAIAGHDTANVSRVDFYANGRNVGSSARFPWPGIPDDFEFDPFFPWALGNTFMVDWTPMGPGTYEIVAVALDEHGNRAASEVRTIIIKPRTASLPPNRPILRQPVQNSSLTSASHIRLIATSFDPDGDLRGVQFYVNGEPYENEQLRDVTVLNNFDQPYSVGWSPPTPGIYVIHAVATDSSGNRSMSAARVVTSTAGDFGKAPQNVTIFRNAPGPDRNLNTGAYVFLQGTAESPDGVIENVQFFMNGQNVGQSAEAPHTARISMPRTGLYEFYAVARDDRNNLVASEPILVSVRAPAGALPDIEMIYPVTPTATTTKSRLPIVAAASDVDQNHVIDPLDVDFFLDRGQHGLAHVSGIDEDTGAIEPDGIDVDYEGYGYAFNPEVIIIGDGEAATAVASMALGEGGLVIDEVIVTNGGRNYTWAQVLFSGGGVFVAQPLGKGIQEHDSAFYRLQDQDPANPGFGFEGRGAGAYRFYAVAADNQSNQRRSSFLPFEDQVVQVEQSLSSPPTNLKLTVSGGTMRNGRMHFAFNQMSSMTVSGQDLDGRIEQVEYFFNGISLNALDNSPNPVEEAPWQYAGNIVVAGDYNVFALVTDNTGVTAMTPPVWITVADPIPPSVTIEDLPSEAYVGIPLTIRVNANGGAGTVRQLQLYVNNEPVAGGLLTSPPYRFRWTPQMTGHLSISVEAENSFGHVAHSPAVGINIMPPGAVVGNPGNPANNAGFVSSVYYDLLGRAPTGVEQRTFVQLLEANGWSRGRVIAELLSFEEPGSESAIWVIAAYLTILGDPPTVEQLEDGIAILASGTGDDNGGSGGDGGSGNDGGSGGDGGSGNDDDDGNGDDDNTGGTGGIRVPRLVYIEIDEERRIPAGLPLVVTEILESFEFVFKYGAAVLNEDEKLLEVVHDGGTYTTKQQRIAQIEAMGRELYLSRLTASRLEKSDLKRETMKTALILLLLDRDTTRAEANQLSSNTAEAAEFIVTRHEYIARFGGSSSFLALHNSQSIYDMKESSWFGEFDDSWFDHSNQTGWLKHTEHGWVYVAPNSVTTNGVWLWDDIQKNWLWSNGGIYSRLYSNDDAKWLFYRQGGTPSLRKFRVHNGAGWEPEFEVRP